MHIQYIFNILYYYTITIILMIINILLQIKLNLSRIITHFELIMTNNITVNKKITRDYNQIKLNYCNLQEKNIDK